MASLGRIAAFVAIFTLALGSNDARAQNPCEGQAGGPEGPPLKSQDTCTVLPTQVGDPLNPSMQDPDLFAWTLFLSVNSPAPPSGVLWETWADQVDVFEAQPNPLDPPIWDEIAGPAQPTQCQPTRAQAVDEKKKRRRRHGEENIECTPTAHEEVRMNQATFDYIVSTLPLWYLEGQIETFHRFAPQGKSITLPTGSKEIKANWVDISPEQLPLYYYRETDEDQFIGLAAMHIISKDIPNWFWSTFEHVDNLCFGLQLKAHDAFGFPDGPLGPMSPELEELFIMFGMDPVESVFANYRLQGAQTTYTDSTGRPIILGNSVTEQGFQTTSSCMTCHSRSVVGADTAGSPFDPKSPGRLYLFNSKDKYRLPNHQKQLQSFNGLPDPDWYFKFKRGKPPELELMQLDFLWSLSCANPTTSTTQFCGCN